MLLRHPSVIMLLMKRKLALPIILPAIVILALGAVGYSLSRSRSTPTSQSPSAPQTELGPQKTALNQPTQDGNFILTVKGVKCGVTKAGPADEYALHALPQGQFCLLDVKVENTTKSQADYSSGGHYLITQDGTRYAPDLYTTSLINNLWRKIDPKMSVDATIAFDLPKGAKPISVEARGGDGARGVVVDLNTKN